jgi:hypothetical protein
VKVVYDIFFGATIRVVHDTFFGATIRAVYEGSLIRATKTLDSQAG